MAVLPVPGNRAVRPGRLRRACQLVRVTAAVTGSDRRPVAFLAGRGAERLRMLRWRTEERSDGAQITPFGAHPGRAWPSMPHP